MKKKKEMKIVFTKQSHDGSGKPFFFFGTEIIRL